MITPIQQISPLQTEKQVQASGASGNDGSLFQSVFRTAIDNVKETDANVVEAEYLMATGQLDNPAALTIAQTKSAIAVDLLVQLRNKSLEAYNELTRISI